MALTPRSDIRWLTPLSGKGSFFGAKYGFGADYLPPMSRISQWFNQMMGLTWSRGKAQFIGVNFKDAIALNQASVGNDSSNPQN
ncbi:hypothetical protein [Microcoleus vaginatus]|uniref:hypothetical protein n=1 Tax=Microcoleus vaginatus TaxID=119532 RepID=UPI001F61FF18